MRSRTKGAWIISHAKKLASSTHVPEFDEVALAGKCGSLLSALAASHEENTLSAAQVHAAAASCGISRIEIDTVTRTLKDAQLLDLSANGDVAVLGVATTSALEHTAAIFDDLNPSSYQNAAIDIAEAVSELPMAAADLQTLTADIHRLAKPELEDLFRQAETIGFVDSEATSGSEKLYFNGNLFRISSADKAGKILDSLTSNDSAKIRELDALLTLEGCLTKQAVLTILGNELLGKLRAIGMYDFSTVSNKTESVEFVTRPSAFSKFGNPFEEDAYDLAKAFVSSLYYGMSRRPVSTGKIQYLNSLLNKLIAGHEVGPATAIGEDYQYLEMKGVIRVRRANGLYFMKLLKKDIGELALQVLEVGDAVSSVMERFYTNKVTTFRGPEENRDAGRRNQTDPSRKAVELMLRTMRG